MSSSRDGNGYPFGNGNQSGAVPKPKTKLEHKRSALDLTDSENLFDLEPKPKSTCIAISQMKKYANELRQTQSLNLPESPEIVDKTWSVIYIGRKTKMY